MLENKNRWEVMPRTVYQDRLLAMLRQYYQDPKDPFRLGLLAEWLDENHVNPGYGNICRERIELNELELPQPVALEDFDPEWGNYKHTERTSKLRVTAHQFYTMLHLLKGECGIPYDLDPELDTAPTLQVFQEDAPTT